MDEQSNMSVEEGTPETQAVAEPQSVSERLRAAREAKGVELSHIAAETRIPIRHLESIEAGRFEDLPSRTYAIGFAKNYARAVGLDREETADAVRAQLAEGETRRSAVAGGMEPGDPAKLPSSGLVWFGGIAAVILAVGAFMFYSTYFAAGTGPAPLVAEGEPEDSERVAVAAAPDVEPATPPREGPVVFTAVGEGAWVRFYEDGGDKLFEGVLEGGDTFEIPADADDPRLNTGRPHMLDITIGGQSVPRLADEMVTLPDAAVSADALLARAGQAGEGATINN
ncbi:MAG: helix-turn-helix domain-containing protein [Erythrobacter sp.]